jgi:hypothetical protein
MSPAEIGVDSWTCFWSPSRGTSHDALDVRKAHARGTRGAVAVGLWR